MKFEFIADQANQRSLPVDYMCRMLDVSRQGYYQWKQRKSSPREQEEEKLKNKIIEIFERHRKRYGVRRVYAELVRCGVRVAYKRVQRLMRTLGLVSVHPRPTKTTIAAANPSRLPDLVGRRFTPSTPNTVWFGDITYVRTVDGWAYIASVLDGHSKKVIGWTVADHMRTDLIISALSMAVQQRQPTGQVIFHADRGSQYTSDTFINFCSRHGIRNSAGRTGICYDNAGAESFWATLKKELIHLHPYETVAKLRRDTFEYIEGYYNRLRIHSTLGYNTPAEHEEQFALQHLQPT